MDSCIFLSVLFLELQCAKPTVCLFCWFLFQPIPKIPSFSSESLGGDRGTNPLDTKSVGTSALCHLRRGSALSGASTALFTLSAVGRFRPGAVQVGWMVHPTGSDVLVNQKTMKMMSHSQFIFFRFITFIFVYKSYIFMCFSYTVSIGDGCTTKCSWTLGQVQHSHSLSRYSFSRDAPTVGRMKLFQLAFHACFNKCLRPCSRDFETFLVGDACHRQAGTKAKELHTALRNWAGPGWWFSDVLYVCKPPDIQYVSI